MSIVSLFQGYDTFKGQLKNTVVDGSKSTPESHISVELSVCTSLKAVQEAVEVDASVGVSYGAYKLDSKASYLHTLNLTTYSVTVIARAKRTQVQGRNTVTIKDSVIKQLTTDPSNVQDFVGKNGDSWVSRLATGSEYFSTYTFHSRNLDEQTKVEASLNASGVIAGVQVDASLATSLSNALQKTDVAYTIDYYMGGTSTVAPPSPGSTQKDIEALIEFAQKFTTIEPDKAETISFAVEPYESLLGKNVDFSTVTANRHNFQGNPASIGWGQMLLDLQQVYNACNEVSKMYEFYGGFTDQVLKDRTAQIKEDLSGMYNFLDTVSENPNKKVTKDDFTTPVSLDWGIPQPIYKFGVPVPSSFLNGGGATDGGKYQDISENQISSLVHIDSINIGWDGTGIGQIIITYSQQYPTIKKDPAPTVWKATHGKSRSSDVPLWDLGDDEFLVKMAGVMMDVGGHAVVGSLKLSTSKGTLFSTADRNPAAGPYKDAGLQPGQIIVGFAGAAGDWVDTLQPQVVQFSPAVWKARQSK